MAMLADSRAKGLSAGLAALAVVAVAAVAFSVYAYQQNQKLASDITTKNSQIAELQKQASAPAKTTPTPTSTPTPATTSFKLSELGIQIVNVPASISDLNFAINPGGTDPSDYISAKISTLSLSKLDQNCSPSGNVSPDGSLFKVDGTYSSQQKYARYFQFVKQFGSFWIGYQHPQSTCSANASTEAIHTSQTSALQTLVTNPSNLETL
jgi:hypothetical protein